MFIAIQIAATLIAASRGWGILPFCIFGLVVLQGLKGKYDIETLMIIDYVSTGILVALAVIKPSQTNK